MRLDEDGRAAEPFRGIAFDDEEVAGAEVKPEFAEKLLDDAGLEQLQGCVLPAQLLADGLELGGKALAEVEGLLVAVAGAELPQELAGAEREAERLRDPPAREPRDGAAVDEEFLHEKNVAGVQPGAWSLRQHRDALQVAGQPVERRAPLLREGYERPRPVELALERGGVGENLSPLLPCEPVGSEGQEALVEEIHLREAPHLARHRVHISLPTPRRG